MRTPVKFCLFFLPITILIFNGCKSVCAVSERFEGLKDGKLRVYARVSYDDLSEENEKRITDQLRTRSNERARKLLEIFLARSNSGPGEKDRSLEEITRILANGVMVCSECSEEYCEAFFDYGVDDIK